MGLAHPNHNLALTSTLYSQHDPNKDKPMEVEISCAAALVIPRTLALTPTLTPRPYSNLSPTPTFTPNLN